MKPLSPRLHSLASFYNLEKEIWDIGCDHGHLGLSFLDRPEVDMINLVDPSSLVIQTLYKNIEDSYITKPEKINVINKKGQNLNIRNLKRKIIFIAGMGGKETREILIHLSPQLDENDVVVISPHKNILEVRAYLTESTYHLKKEDVIQENQRFYQILALSQSPQLARVTRFGEAIWQGPLAATYRSYILSTFKSHQDELSKDFVTYLEGLSR